MIGAILAVEKVGAAFESLNQRDVAQFLAGWADDATFVYPGGLPVSGEFAGKPAIEAWFRRFLEQFPRFHFSLQSVSVANFLDITGTNVVSAEWTAVATNRQGREFRNRGVNVINLQKGRAVHVRDYIFDYTAQKESWAE